MHLATRFCSTVLILAAFSAAYPQNLPVTRSEFKQAREQLIKTKRALLQRARTQRMQVSGQGGYDAKTYRLDLNIEPDLQQISGYVVMTATAVSDNLQTVDLDFYASMFVDGVGGDAAGFSRAGDVLTLNLRNPVAKGQPFSVRVDYHGQPASNGFGSFGFKQHNGAPIIWSLSEPYYARTWWPCKDSPNDKADSVDVILTVPSDLVAASNGALLSNQDNGDGTRTFHWHESYPITTYLVSVAITNYRMYSEPFTTLTGDEMEVVYYVYPENFSGFLRNVPPVLDILTYFHRIFGPYPFFREKYGIAQFPWSGGMEHQTITSQGNFTRTLSVHELAHQWWGDKITNANWHEIWLNEGFASYAEALYYEHARGNSYYHTYMGYMDRYFPFAIYVDDTTSVSRIFANTVYDKGAWFLHMLRKIVGDANFFDILLAYSADSEFAYANATTAGFQRVCESVSGQDLSWFFQSWIYNRGRPVYRVTWNAADSAGAPRLNLNIKQTQVSYQSLFPMPVDVKILTDLGDTLVTVFNDLADQQFEIPLRGRPIFVEIDPGGWILKTVESITAVAEQSTQAPADFRLRQNYPNPFNGETAIAFELPREERVELEIFNIAGQRVRLYAPGPLRAGVHRITWDGRDGRGRFSPSGLYVYELRAGAFRQARKLLFLK